MNVCIIICVTSAREGPDIAFVFDYKHTLDVFIVICVVFHAEDNGIAFTPARSTP